MRSPRRCVRASVSARASHSSSWKRKAAWVATRGSDRDPVDEVYGILDLEVDTDDFVAGCTRDGDGTAQGVVDVRLSAWRRSRTAPCSALAATRTRSAMALVREEPHAACAERDAAA